MTLREEIIGNWRTDIISNSQRIESLCDEGFPCWTVKYPDSYGVAIPYTGTESVNEFFTNAHIWDDVIDVKDKSSQKVIILSADYSVSRESFSTLCEGFVMPGENGSRRTLVSHTPLTWWQDWKELLGNRNIDERVYDTLGELCVLKYLCSEGKDATWEGPMSATYDIELEDGFVEVKSTTTRSKKEVTIHSKYQLDPPGKTLDLVFCIFEQTVNNGCSIDSVVADIVSLGISEEYLNERLSKKGFEKGMSARKRMFILHEMLKYKIDDSFPRITPESFVEGHVPVGITGYSYTVNLDGLSPETLIQDICL